MSKKKVKVKCFGHIFYKTLTAWVQIQVWQDVFSSMGLVGML